MMTREFLVRNWSTKGTTGQMDLQTRKLWSPDLTPDGDQKIIEQTVAKSRRLPDKLLSGQKNFWEALCFHIVSASHFTIPVEALHFDDSSGDDSLPEVCAYGSIFDIHQSSIR
jgi:hypothetical protein